jgi:hypothetical protein
MVFVCTTYRFVRHYLFLVQKFWTVGLCNLSWSYLSFFYKPFIHRNNLDLPNFRFQIVGGPQIVAVNYQWVQGLELFQSCLLIRCNIMKEQESRPSHQTRQLNRDPNIIIMRIEMVVITET